MNTKELKINSPEGYEIDKENSTFECIKFKPIQEVRTWEDIDRIKGVYINELSNILSVEGIKVESDKNIFIDKKHVKSALAMAQISQLMTYYGGVITDEEWDGTDMPKYCIERNGKCIEQVVKYHSYRFLAFHTKEQRDRFMCYEENVQLVKDYLMID